MNDLLRLLAQEDTDGDRRITIRDQGPRVYTWRGIRLEGTYRLSVLLQELAAADAEGRPADTIPLARFDEHPLDRASRLIRTEFWDGLTRSLHPDVLADAVADPKVDGLRLYIPEQDQANLEVYQGHPEVEVIPLPAQLTPAAVYRLNERPGLLSLALSADGAPLPYVVPGGRFNEMYGWDSYFILQGLLCDERVDLAKAMVDHACYQVRHYGKILNANRTYYLSRSQPPFLADMIWLVWRTDPRGLNEWAAGCYAVAKHEYESVWTATPRRTPTGLARYYGTGIGAPPETESGHFNSVFAPFAEAHGQALDEFESAYRSGLLDVPELDAHFVHDRAMRESGHDTTNRLDGRAAHVNPVALNAFLYRFEQTMETLAQAIPTVSDHDATLWANRAQQRRVQVDRFLWSEDEGLYFDYDVAESKPHRFLAATALVPLWAGLSTPEQAERLIDAGLSRLEAPGGLAATTEADRGPVTLSKPQRQWDFPFGWAPHQMLAWEGLRTYGFDSDANRLASNWLTMAGAGIRDFNGTVPEKYDVVHRTHEAFAEYGNVGTDFDYLTREGFGWTNASIQIALRDLPDRDRRQAYDDVWPAP